MSKPSNLTEWLVDNVLLALAVTAAVFFWLTPIVLIALHIAGAY